jgi:hypothetical protein
LRFSHSSFTLRNHARRMTSSGLTSVFWPIRRTSWPQMARRRTFTRALVVRQCTAGPGAAVACNNRPLLDGAAHTPNRSGQDSGCCANPLASYLCASLHIGYLLAVCPTRGENPSHGGQEHTTQPAQLPAPGRPSPSGFGGVVQAWLARTTSHNQQGSAAMRFSQLGPLRPRRPELANDRLPSSGIPGRGVPSDQRTRSARSVACLISAESAIPNSRATLSD